MPNAKIQIPEKLQISKSTGSLEFRVYAGDSGLPPLPSAERYKICKKTRGTEFTQSAARSTKLAHASTLHPPSRIPLKHLAIFRLERCPARGPILPASFPRLAGEIGGGGGPDGVQFGDAGAGFISHPPFDLGFGQVELVFGIPGRGQGGVL